MGKQRRVTLNQIAKAANVSAMTVSRALRNCPKISAARREQIQRLAVEMGYRPNPTLSRLMAELRRSSIREETHVIAALHLFPSEDIIKRQNNPHIWRYLEGARERAAQLGFRLDLFNLGEPPMKPQRLRQILVTRGIEGLLLLPFPYDCTRLEMDFSSFAVAALGRSQVDQPFHRACANHFSAIDTAFAKAMSCGYQRIGAVFSDVIDRRAGRRFSAAFLQQQHFHPGTTHIPVLDLPSASDKELGAWIERYEPDVVLGMGNRTLERIRTLGFRVPADLSYINLSIVLDDPSVAGINANYDRVAAAAVDLIASQLNNNERGLSLHPKSVLIDGFWMEGDSFVSGRLPVDKRQQS